MTGAPLIGYTERLHVAAGGRVSVHVSAPAGAFDARLVTLAGTVGGQTPVPSHFEGRYSAAEYPILPGSSMTVPQGVPCPRLPGITLWIRPTRPTDGREQALLCWGADHGLFLDTAGRLVARWGTARILSAEPIPSHRWSALRLECGDGTLRLDICTRDGSERRSGGTAPMAAGDALPSPLAFRIAALPEGGGFYDGKIARPCISDGDLVLARWAFDAAPSSNTVPDRGPDARHGLLMQGPQTGMTGPDWSGDASGWREAPDQYDAIAFHSDDLSDAGWPAAFTFEPPPWLPSGVYGIELQSGGQRDVLPLFVTPAPKAKPAPLAFIVPTFSYLAYANERHWWSNPAVEAIAGAPLDAIVGPLERWGEKQRLLSAYDYHHDGSGNACASSRRPLVNMRADYVHPLLRGPHQLSGDILTIEWLRSIGQPVDFLTDHDLHERGAAALAPYRAVMTGSHPEYVSRQIFDAVERYVADGGRLIHLGGNAFYFVTSLFPEEPHRIEVRRGFAGTIPWQSEPGELRHASTGELGGLWRWRGRSAHGLLGTGTAAVSFGKGRPYIRSDASRDPRFAWIFEGVDGEAIDAHSVLMGGPAGFEIDAMRHDLGTPADAIRLASATDFDTMAYMAAEDVLSTGVRGVIGTDMVYRAVPGGGCVFSAPSIAWTGCLADKGGDNAVARITRNVLQAFLSPAGPPTAPAPFSEETGHAERP